MGHEEVRDGCFIAGTPVQTQDGPLAIEALHMGARVLAADPENAITAHRAVMRTFVHMVPIVLDLSISGTVVTCSPAHPFWVAGRGWARASELVVLDRVATAAGTDACIEAIVKRCGEFTVYNVTVDDLSTFHVSELGILVHNKPMRLDLRAIFDSRKASLHESITLIRSKIERLKKLARANDDLAVIKTLEANVDELQRQVHAARFTPLPEGADPAMHFDPLSQSEHLEDRVLHQVASLETSLRPKPAIPSTRPALDAETVLADVSAYTPTGKSYQGREIYRDADGKYYYVDNFHKGAGSEIEVFGPTGEHLGTMAPEGTFSSKKKKKNRKLPGNLR